MTDRHWEKFHCPILFWLVSLALLFTSAGASTQKAQHLAFVSGRPYCYNSVSPERRKHQEKFKSNRDAPRNRLSLEATRDKTNDNHQRQSSSLKLLWTMKELEEFALREGVALSISTLGPGFRVVARSTHNSSKILGYGEGFVRPAGEILHLDKMEVFKPMVQQVKQENPDFRGGGTTFGVGLLFGYQSLLHGLEKGCTIAEFLAIDDEDFQHKRLVRYYSRAGFKVIKYVGDDFQDIPDRMVWGGCGTLMRANIDDLLPLWTQLLSRASSMEQS